VVAVMIAAGSWIGCGAAASAFKGPVSVSARRVWWSPALELSSLAEIPAQLARPFPEPFPVARVTPGGGLEQGAVASCSDYFAKTGQGFQAVSDQDVAVLQAMGARCSALRLIDVSRFQVTISTPPYDLQRVGLDILPPSLGPQVSPTDRDARQAATKKGLSWKTFDPAARYSASTADRARIAGADWSVALELWATGDFDGSGADQLLVFTRATGTEGTWQESKLRILRRISAGSRFVVLRELAL
jgi:hypothetical protein